MSRDGASFNAGHKLNIGFTCADKSGLNQRHAVLTSNVSLDMHGAPSIQI